MRVADVAEFLGGSRVLQREVRTDMELAEAVREGLPAGALDHVLERARGWAGSHAPVYRVVGTARTLERKRGVAGAVLKPAESDRLARLARLVVRAEEAFGNADKAHRWLMKPSRALGGAVPFELLDSDAGTVAVERELGRIEHGIAA